MNNNKFGALVKSEPPSIILTVSTTSRLSILTIEGISYRPMELKVKSETSSGVWLDICLKEGKNREIRKIFNYHDE